MYNFSKKFEESGFRKETFLPVYGLAESTLASTFTNYRETPKYVVVDNKDIGIGVDINLKSTGVLNTSREYMRSKDEIVVFSVGESIENMDYNLIDHEGNEISSELKTGEIVLNGTSVAIGYLSGISVDKPFNNTFKTGDLGFVYNNELYILDRIKNLIIRNGKNYIYSFFHF